MATINLGSIKFNWQGAYAGGTAYAVDDVVEYNGSSYICILASTGNLPTNATYFEQMSSAGTNGTDLTSTLTTQGDLVYRDGSGLQRLGAGTSGQALITNGTGANPSWGDVSGGGDLSNSGASQNVYKHELTSQVDINSNSWVPTGMLLTIPQLSVNTDFIVTFSEARKEQSWNMTVGQHQYSVDGGSNWSDLNETNFYFDNTNGDNNNFTSVPDIYHVANCNYYLSFTSGQTPQFRVRGTKVGSSNNYRLNFAPQVKSTIIAIKVLP